MLAGKQHKDLASQFCACQMDAMGTSVSDLGALACLGLGLAMKNGVDQMY